jgi:hypothetical protein
LFEYRQGSIARTFDVNAQGGAPAWRPGRIVAPEDLP